MCCVHLLNVGLLKRLNERLRHIRLLFLPVAPFKSFTKSKTHKIHKPNHTYIKRTHENGENHDNKNKRGKNANGKRRGRAKHFKELCMKNAKTKKYFAPSRSVMLALCFTHVCCEWLGWPRSKEISSVVLLTVCLQNTLQQRQNRTEPLHKFSFEKCWFIFFSFLLIQL